MSMKTGIVILAVLALCFFTGVGNGLLRMNEAPPSTGTPVPTPGWGQRLDALFPRGKVAVKDVLNANPDSCVINRTSQQLEVLAGQSCSYTLSTPILPRNVFLCLKPGTGTWAIVTISQPGDGTATATPLTEKILWPGTLMKFEAPTRQLSITCQDLATTCIIRILRNIDQQCS